MQEGNYFNILNHLLQNLQTAASQPESETVVVLGQAGAGKSLATGYLLGAPICKKKANGFKVLSYVDDSPSYPTLAHDEASQTLFPKVYSSTTTDTLGMTFCDTVALKTHKEKREKLKDLLLLDAALQTTGRIKAVIVVFTYYMLETERGKYFKELNQLLGEWLQNPFDYEKSIFFLVTQSEKCEKKVKVKQKTLWTVKQFLKQFEDEIEKIKIEKLRLEGLLKLEEQQPSKLSPLISDCDTKLAGFEKTCAMLQLFEKRQEYIFTADFLDDGKLLREQILPLLKASPSIKRDILDLSRYLQKYYLQQFLQYVKSLPKMTRERACKQLVNCLLLAVENDNTALQAAIINFKNFFFTLGLKSRIWKTVLALVLTFACVLVVSGMIASVILLHAHGNGGTLGHNLLQVMSGLLSTSMKHLQSVLPALTVQTAKASVLGAYLGATSAALFVSGVRATQAGTRLEYVALKVTPIG